MRSLIIFDLDGTLAHTAPDLLATLNRVTAPSGIKPVNLDVVGQVVGQGAKAMIAKAFELSNAPLDPDFHNTLLQNFLADYAENLARDTHLFEGVLEAMEDLEKDGYEFAVCTNKLIEMAEPLLAQLGVANRFKSITGGNSFEFRKPDPRHLIETAKLANKRIEQAIMIGDSSADIDAANNANIPSVAVSFGYTQTPARELGASCVIDHYRELVPAIQRMLTI